MNLRPILVAGLLAWPACAADPSLFDLLPPSPTFVLGVRLREVAAAPVIQSLLGEVRQAAGQMNLPFAAPGFDPVRDVDEVILAAAGSGKNPPGLIIARGRFQEPMDRAAGIAYHGVVVSGKRDSSVAFLDESTLVAGDVAMVRGAIDRRGRGANGELRARAAELAGRYQIYGFGSVPAGAVPEAGAGAAIKGIDRFWFGASLARGLDLAAELHARTARDAQGLSQAIALMTAMMGRQKGAENFAKNLDVRMEGEALRIALIIPEAELMKAVKTREQSSPASRRAGVQPAAPPAPRRDPRFAPDTALIVTGSESDGGTIVISNPKRP